MSSQDYALVVGIDHYPQHRDLQGSINDANDFWGWLIDPRGGGVPKENCILVTSVYDPNDPDGLRPFQYHIDNKLDVLLSRLRRLQMRRFYLYLAGHGIAPSRDEVNLCLAGWHSYRQNLALDTRSYLNYLVDTGIFRELILFADCCRSRSKASGSLKCTLTNIKPQPGASSCRIFEGYASEYLTTAFEGSGDLARGFFTEVLMEGLKGAAANAQGNVTASSLQTYLELQTPILAATHANRQTPVFRNGFLKQGEPIFGPVAPTTGQVEIQFSSARQGHNIRLLDPLLAVVQEYTATPQPWSLPSLRKGTYTLEDTSMTPIQNHYFPVIPSQGVTHVSF